MATTVIDAARIHEWRAGAVGDGFVLYWMQQAQRAESNPALEFAIRLANDSDRPLAVVFCLVAAYPDAAARHYTFMLQGLAEVAPALTRRGIAFEVLRGAPADVVGALAHRTGAVVMDGGYLPLQRSWREDVVTAVDVPVYEIDTDVVVPPSLVSDKLETAARTIRPKILDRLDDFIVELGTVALDRRSAAGSEDAISLSRTATGIEAVDLTDISGALESCGVSDHPAPVDGWPGGTTAAKDRLASFLDRVLPDYDNLRNRYDLDHSSSKLSPYLHFGQISPVEVARQVRRSDAPRQHVESFVEELVVRRELAVNYVLHVDAHDAFAGLPGWAKDSLREHADDRRPDVLTATELEHGQTDDVVWNTIMQVIRRDGWVHNQLRMYWGKQIIRWTNTPEHAFRTLLDLNNRYFLDGRDPNSFANVAWCFGRHDQGFQERQIIGKVRPFTDKALRRKGDLDSWVERNRAERSD